MELSPERLEAFRAIYRAQFGIELTPQETLEKALALLTFMKAVYQPMTEDDMERIQERRKELFINQPVWKPLQLPSTSPVKALNFVKAEVSLS